MHCAQKGGGGGGDKRGPVLGRRVRGAHPGQQQQQWFIYTSNMLYALYVCRTGVVVKYSTKCTFCRSDENLC